MTPKDSWIDILTWVVLLVFVSPFIVYTAPQLLGYNAHIVESGSMRPSMPPGSVMFETSVNPRNIETGDVIVFRPNDTRMEEDLVTHRVVDIREGNYSLQFRTMGDANSEPDPGWTPDYRVTGKKLFSIPFLGTVISVFQSLPVILAMVGLPSAILIRKELLKILENMEEEDTATSEKDGEKKIYFYEKHD
jgi:signal peptidase